MKANSYKNIFASSYFWRTYTGAELDLVEERDGNFHGYELKWSSKKVNAPKTWIESYPGSTFQNINADNFLDWLRHQL